MLASEMSARWSTKTNARQRPSMMKTFLIGALNMALIVATLAGCSGPPPGHRYRASSFVPSPGGLDRAFMAFDTCILTAAGPIDNKKDPARSIAVQAMGACFTQWQKVESLDEEGLSEFNRMRMESGSLQREIKNATEMVRIERQT